jgi:hypothetical protein
MGRLKVVRLKVKFVETDQNGAALAGMSRHHRSAVTNRTKLFAIEGMDGRLGPARRFRDILEQIECDVGGIGNLSEGQRQLCRRAATLSFTAECMEVDAVAGKPFDIDLFGQLTDRLGRCLQRLGLERKARSVNDGSHVLADYFSRPSPKEAAP